MSNGVTVVSSKNLLALGNKGAPGQGQDQASGFRGKAVLFGERYAELNSRQQFYECTQHDRKIFDFDGRVWNPRTGNPLISSEAAAFYVPLKSRRPNAPYRLPKIIVDSFTTLLFGENRFPKIVAEGDPKTEDYAQAISRAGNLELKMIRARNLGGCMGTVGVSWCFRQGRPYYEVHNAKNLFAHRWTDRDKLIPEHVTEVYAYPRVQWNGKEFARVWYWYRRDWTPDWDMIFKPVLFEPNKEPVWEPDLEKSVEHHDGRCHLVWIQNLPSEDIDGLPDYDGQYDACDSLDILMSVVMRGATLNLDPTLVLKMDPDLVKRVGVKKGSDNALTVGQDGDASYLELGGSSVDAGVKLIELVRRSILEAAQCVVPDPHEVAAQGVSSVAIKAMYSPMLGKADILRSQYGGAIERLLEEPVKVMQIRSKTTVPCFDELTGEEVMGTPVLSLPPKVEKDTPIDPVTGVPGEEVVSLVEREPGQAEEIDLHWPAYFPPTPADQSQIATTLTAATGGKAFISKQTAVESAASAFNVDPTTEWRRVEEEHHKDREQEKAMMQDMDPGTGGQVPPGKGNLPPGATPKKSPFGKTGMRIPVVGKPTETKE